LFRAAHHDHQRLRTQNTKWATPPACSNLMRNIGASIGIASVTTLGGAQTCRSTLMIWAAHITAYDRNAARPCSIPCATGSCRKGWTQPPPRKQSYGRTLRYMVQQQAAMLSYIDAFLSSRESCFIAVLPLVLLIERSLSRGGPIEMGAIENQPKQRLSRGAAEKMSESPRLGGRPKNSPPVSTAG